MSEPRISICGAVTTDAYGARHVCARRPRHGGNHRSAELTKRTKDWAGIEWPAEESPPFEVVAAFKDAAALGHESEPCRHPECADEHGHVDECRYEED